MKLAKTVIVSGLLFSSVLGSVNIGGITAMAATPSVEVPGATNPGATNPGATNPGATNPGATNPGATNPEIKKVHVKYIIDGKLLSEKIDGLMEDVNIESTATSIKLSQLHINSSKYKVKDNKKEFAINNNVITVELNAVKEVAIQRQKPSKRPSAPRYTIQRVRITFVDQNSKDLVGYKQVTGKASFSTKIEAPKGYSFTNAKYATIKFDKKGNKNIKVFVKKMTSAPVKHEGIITTTNGSYKRLYTLEGKMITNRALGVNSKWYTDQYATINGEKMYRVATNEWVKASDVL